MTSVPKLPASEVDVAIVGAGFAGLGMAIQLKRHTDQSFVVLERGASVGGTWRDNTYPGVACDVPSHLYSFSFLPKPDWTRVYSPGAEILDYLQRAALEEGILPHLHLGTEMTATSWDSERRRWTVETGNGQVVASYLVVATGHLADERLPDIPGIEGFTGSVFHSSRWDHDTSLTNKRVGVVGTGASAIQIVPSIVDDVSQLVVFQRSAAYVQPRRDRPYSAGERTAFARDPELAAAVRADLFWNFETQYAARRREEPFLSTARQTALTHLHTQVADPELRRKLTPGYEIGCKRALVSNDFYPALTQSHVTLEDSALARFEGSTAISTAGHRFELDCVVLATGFEATEPRIAPLIRARDGRTLADHWQDGMHALDSIAVPSFPNMFILDGPNTGLGHNSAIFIIESQLQYVMSALNYGAQSSAEVLEAKPSAEADYMSRLTERTAGTVWLEGGCRNWYVDPRSERVTVLWPDFAHRFRDQNSAFVPERYEVTS